MTSATEIIENARDLAVLALCDREGNISARLERLSATAQLPNVDKSLACELALGVTRRRGTLQAVLRAFLTQPNRRPPGVLNEILMVGLYQILFLDRVPDFAAVNEAVDQASRFRHKRQSGFVNGVLRTVTRNVSAIMQGCPMPARNVLPISPSSYRKLARSAFADPHTRPVEYLAAAYSLPPSLAQRWLGRCESLTAAIELAMHANVRAPLILRVNRLKGNLSDAIAALKADGLEALPHANGCSVVPDRYTNVRELGAFNAGLVQPQDATATAVSLAAAPRPGTEVLDFCAAPGTKTTHLAELMDNSGSITAVDVSPAKLARIEDNCRRMGISIVKTHLADQVAELEPGSFDLVLADVPCSNTGVLARRPEARWRFSDNRLSRLVRDQQFIIAAARQFVRPGGRLVYSTCSMEFEENQRVTQRLCKKMNNATLAEQRSIRPEGAEDPTCWCDGGYYAIFKIK